jgi:LCP family protein required for cell wall assembly
MSKKTDFSRLLALLVVLSGIIYFYFNLFAPRSLPGFLQFGVPRRPYTILLIGTDLTFDREGGKPLPDSRNRETLTLLSIPRDSFVPLQDYGWHKINAANVFGGLPLIKETITSLTGIKIDRFIEINPLGLIKLIDLAGGVNILVEKELKYTDRAQKLFIDLPAGWQKLSGEKAQGYARFRHDAFGDIGRIERQQKLVQALLLALARPNNLAKAPVALGIAAGNIRTDLSLKEIIRLANFLRLLPSKKVHSLTVPGEAANVEAAGSVWQINRPELKKLIEQNF